MKEKTTPLAVCKPLIDIPLCNSVERLLGSLLALNGWCDFHVCYTMYVSQFLVDHTRHSDFIMPVRDQVTFVHPVSTCRRSYYIDSGIAC